MPERLRRYLISADWRAHFWRALGVGLLLRLLSAFFVYGPQALDDYKHGVWPAYQFFAGQPLTDLPDYRSHFLVWFLSIFVYIGSWLGISSALGQVRAMYFGLAFTSLVGIIGTERYGRLSPDRLASRLMLYVVAIFPLMPFVSTRAFGESIATNFVLLGFGWLEWTRQRQPQRWQGWLFGFLMLGVATLFRFHCGLLFLTYAGVLLYLRQVQGVQMAALAGVITAGAQALIDILSGKAPLGTLFIYLSENEGGGAKYGVSPWYTTWLFVLGVGLVPFSLVLFHHWRRLWREQWPVLVSWLFFVAVHSAVAHKEERFLYPILGLELWALAFLWAESAGEKWARRIFSPVIIGVTGVLLPIVCFVNSQEGEIEPPAYVQSRYDNVMYLDSASLFGLSRFQFYFLRPPSELSSVPPTEFNAHRIDAELIRVPQRKAVVLLTSDPEARNELRALRGMQTAMARCQDLRESGSVIDRLLYKMNPKHNQRRRPTWYLICERL